MELLDQFAQVMVFFTGVIALYLAGATSTRQRMWGGIFGLCGEPFWLITSLVNEQRAVTLLVLIYGYNWWRVYWNNRKALAASVQEKNPCP